MHGMVAQYFSWRLHFRGMDSGNHMKVTLLCATQNLERAHIHRKWTSLEKSDSPSRVISHVLHSILEWLGSLATDNIARQQVAPRGLPFVLPAVHANYLTGIPGSQGPVVQKWLHLIHACDLTLISSWYNVSGTFWGNVDTGPNRLTS